MWNLLNPLDPTYSYGNRVHVQRRVHACGSDSNRAQSSACMRDLACNLSVSLRASSPAIGRRVAVARGVQRVSWYGGPVAGAARCSVGSEPFLHRILYSGLAASHRGAVKRSDWHTWSEERCGINRYYIPHHTGRAGYDSARRLYATSYGNSQFNATTCGDEARVFKTRRRRLQSFIQHINPSEKFARWGRKGGEAATRQHAATL